MFESEEGENNSYPQQSKGRRGGEFEYLKRDWIVWMCLFVIEDAVICACVCMPQGECV